MTCKGMTHDSRWPYCGNGCTRQEWKDGYCKIHHPEEKLRRNKKRMLKKEEEYNKAR